DSLCSSGGKGTTYYNKQVYMPSDDPGNSVLKAKNGALTGTFPGDFTPSIFAIGKRKYMLTVTYHDGTVYCTSLGSGNVVWKFTAPAIVFTPAVYANGYVMIGDYANNVFVLNAKTGEQVWTTTMSHPIYNIAAGQGTFVVSASDVYSPGLGEVAAFAPQ
ncbi:MAG: PQQ-binding-like beta-propeller repeat protein, partial [Alphaproteobacteria bacterium]|nr:PQQ-binding-like beta-propeller repeat protein [Alphaproteobacteria bacterium]